MAPQSVLITGSSGLIGSECVAYFDRLGWRVHGVDNNMRMVFFGADGDTRTIAQRLVHSCRNFEHHDLDIRFRQGILQLIKEARPALVIHCAAQPSHELAKACIFDSFDINTCGTFNLLEAAHQFCADSPFVFMSTNKVYGDAPNELPLRELDTRWDYARPEHMNGIDESCRIDTSLHSLYGASKAAADLLVQEFGRYFGMPTACFRTGSLTGPQHAGAELHGFLSYLARCFQERREYRIIGYKGKQVRDVIHCHDVAEAIYAFYQAPRRGAVYNLGGGRQNSTSILEAITAFTEVFGHSIRTEYIDQNRLGDQICYISDQRRFRADYPNWMVQVALPDIFRQFVGQANAATTRRG
jgi:CDP-paratose 2-epimerase